MKPYWHEAPEEELLALVENKVTIKESMEIYSQPEWCDYPDALSGIMGCCSLMDIKGTRKLISHDFCKDCDCYNDKTPNL